MPLWIIPAKGGSARRIGDLVGHAGTWSRDGRRIVFSRGSALFRVNVDGTDCRKLVDIRDGIADCLRRSPASGPDVVRLHVVRRDMREGSLWEVASDGTGLHPLLRGRASGAGWPDGDYSGSWIPSGKYYVFRSVRGPVASIWALRENRDWMPVLDQRPVQIYSTPLAFVSLAPSADGKRVFFSAGRERRELVRYDARRGQFMPYLSGVAARWVSFSKDGRWVAYTTFAEGTLWRSRSDGSERMQLTPPPVVAGLPRWSPDGSRIAFYGGASDKPGEVYVIPSAGGAMEAIAPCEGEPSWSADGNSLLLACRPRAGGPRPGLHLMDWATRKTTWVPGSEGIFRAAWSPDFRYIAGNLAGSQILAT